MGKSKYYYKVKGVNKESMSLMSIFFNLNFKHSLFIILWVILKKSFTIIFLILALNPITKVFSY